MACDALARLDRLEQTVRRQRCALVACVGTVVLVLAMATSTQPGREIDVRQLRIVDDQGNVRIALGYARDSSYCRMYDKNGKARLGLLASQALSSVGVHGADEAIPQASLGLSEKGPYVWLADDQGKTRGALAVSKETAALTLSARGEEESISLLAEKSKPQLSFRNGEGTNRCVLGIFETGPALVLADKNAEPQGVFRLQGDAPVILLRDIHGKDVWRVPDAHK